MISILEGGEKDFVSLLVFQENELIRGSVTIIQEQFFARLDHLAGKDSNAMVAIDLKTKKRISQKNHVMNGIDSFVLPHLQNFSVAIWVKRMIGESDLVSLPGGIEHELVVQVEEEGRLVLVVHFSPAVCLVLGDDLSAVLGNKVIAAHGIPEEDPPPSHV